MHVQERAGLREGAEVPGQLQTAIVFVDLAGFTSLADAMGDHMAAQLLERLSHIVRDAVGRWEGHVVKQIGDAFMLVALALEASRLHGGAEALADIAVGRARARASPRKTTGGELGTLGVGDLGGGRRRRYAPALLESARLPAVRRAVRDPDPLRPRLRRGARRLLPSPVPVRARGPRAVQRASGKDGVTSEHVTF